jgi:hypothetical protein
MGLKDDASDRNLQNFLYGDFKRVVQSVKTTGLLDFGLIAKRFGNMDAIKGSFDRFTARQRVRILKEYNNRYLHFSGYSVQVD